MTDDEPTYIVLDDDLYAKGIFLLRGQYTKVLKECFDMYGQGIYIPGAVDTLVRLAEDWGLYVRGDVDKPISADYVRRDK